MTIGHLAGLFLLSVALAGCNYQRTPDPVISARDTELLAISRSAPVDPMFERYLVENPTGEPEGTIVVETRQHLLFLVLPGGKAMRYGVSIGKEGFGWTGEAWVRREAEWPDWTPPAEMVERWPHVRPTKGGPNSPLGARALYLYDAEGRDTLYRIHGTNEPTKIGRSVSSGCIRMRNIDVIDLAERVGLGTRVIVR